jgi:hypothetical protein
MCFFEHAKAIRVAIVQLLKSASPAGCSGHRPRAERELVAGLSPRLHIWDREAQSPVEYPDRCVMQQYTCDVWWLSWASASGRMQGGASQSNAAAMIYTSCVVHNII